MSFKNSDSLSLRFVERVVVLASEGIERTNKINVVEEEAKANAIILGAIPQSVEIFESEVTPLPYLAGCVSCLVYWSSLSAVFSS